MKEKGISFAPILPRSWTAYNFKICFAGSRILVEVKENECVFTLECGREKNILVYGKEYLLKDRLIIRR